MSDMLDQHREYVLRTVEERGVRLVRLWFTDVLGTLKSCYARRKRMTSACIYKLRKVPMQVTLIRIAIRVRLKATSERPARNRQAV
jgi:glutamine synthetase